LEHGPWSEQFQNAHRRHREDMVENAYIGIEKETSHWRDHIRIQIHPTTPWVIGRKSTRNKKKEDTNVKNTSSKI
jgi:hypothetical protein